MRHLRPFLALLAMAALIVACSTPGSGSPDESNGGGGEATATPDGGGGGEATATPGGGGGGGANGSVTYQITGDYEASGELPFAPIGLSVFDSANAGWVAYFAGDEADTALIQMNTIPDSLIVNYGDGTALIVGTEDTGCSFNFTRNDSGGLAGSFQCNGVLGFMNEAGSSITVNFNGEFDAHT